MFDFARRERTYCQSRETVPRLWAVAGTATISCRRWSERSVTFSAPRGELQLGRELRGRDGARMAGCDDVERRLLALREVIGEVAVQRSRP